MEDFVPIGLFTSSLCGLWALVFVVQIGFSLVIGLVSIAGLVMWIVMLLDVIQRDVKTFTLSENRLVWVLIIILTGWAGALVYYFAEYRGHKGLGPGQVL